MIKILVCNAQNRHGMESTLKRKTRKTTPKMQTQRFLINSLVIKYFNRSSDNSKFGVNKKMLHDLDRKYTDASVSLPQACF